MIKTLVIQRAFVKKVSIKLNLLKHLKIEPIQIKHIGKINILQCQLKILKKQSN